MKKWKSWALASTALTLAMLSCGYVAYAGVGAPKDSSVIGVGNTSNADSSLTSTIPGNVPLAPEPGPDVNSFSYSRVQQVSHTSHATLKFGCPAGFYVRPGSGDIWGDNSPEPLSKTFVGNTVLMQQTTGLESVYPYSGTPANAALYQGVQEGYWNAGTSTHHFTLTIWCDRLANPSTAALRAAKQAITAAPQHFNASLQSVSTGQYLDGGDEGDTAEMSDSPTTMFFSGDQEGDGNNIYGAAAFGVWAPGTDNFVGPNLGFDGAVPTWYGSGSGTANGGVLLPVFGNNQSDGEMLVQANSITVPSSGNVPDKTVGTGGQCLTAPGNGGDPLLEDCDATNPSQYWNFPNP
ncbi:hypothetical protein [Curtobacterium sp. L1-20]|uniref:hypothetical protein n=1 Tax=Curtobacterium sp. L1-20 TaxID=3138181 RepID=UPI003B524870